METLVGPSMFFQLNHSASAVADADTATDATFNVVVNSRPITATINGKDQVCEDDTEIYVN